MNAESNLGWAYQCLLGSPISGRSRRSQYVYCTRPTNIRNLFVTSHILELLFSFLSKKAIVYLHMILVVDSRHNTVKTIIPPKQLEAVVCTHIQA